MFDHCDTDTQAVIDTAHTEAERLDHHWIGTEHALIALTLHRDRLPPPVAQLLPATDQVRDALAAATDPVPPDRHADLLRTLGVDLDHVRDAVRRTFGAEAVDRIAARHVHQPWQPWRRPTRACTSLLSRPRHLAPRLEEAIGRAARHAQAHQRLVDPAGLLAGILDLPGARATAVLDDLGIDLPRLRAAISARS